MPRAPMPPCCCFLQSSFPVAASRAAIVLFCGVRYITPSITSGLKMTVPLTGNVHATSSWETFDLLICSSAENCDECAPPPYAVQVVYGFAPRVPLVLADVFERDCPPGVASAATTT